MNNLIIFGGTALLLATSESTAWIWGLWVAALTYTAATEMYLHTRFRA